MGFVILGLILRDPENGDFPREQYLLAYSVPCSFIKEESLTFASLLPLAIKASFRPTTLQLANQTQLLNIGSPLD